MSNQYENLVKSIQAETRLSASAFELISGDFERAFAYVHPNTENLSAYGHRFYEILFRTCTEFEILAKAAYGASFQEDPSRKNISQLSRVLQVISVPEAMIRFDGWEGPSEFLSTHFKGWASDQHELGWFRSYNYVKHNRHENFRHANLKNCINSMASLFFLIVSLGGIKYSSFFRTPRNDGVEFPFISLNFSVIALGGWSPPPFLDATPDAP